MHESTDAEIGDLFWLIFDLMLFSCTKRVKTSYEAFLGRIPVSSIFINACVLQALNVSEDETSPIFDLLKSGKRFALAYSNSGLPSFSHVFRYVESLISILQIKVLYNVEVYSKQTLYPFFLKL